MVYLHPMEYYATCCGFSELVLSRPHSDEMFEFPRAPQSLKVTSIRQNSINHFQCGSMHLVRAKIAVLLPVPTSASAAQNHLDRPDSRVIRSHSVNSTMELLQLKSRQFKTFLSNQDLVALQSSRLN